jgi:peptide/nickel transport system permease protein
VAAGGNIAVGTGAFESLGEEERAHQLQRAIRVWRHKPLGVLGVLIIFVFMFMAIFAPVIQRYEPDRPFQIPNPNYGAVSDDPFSDAADQTVLDKVAGPSAKHWLGTDDGGRDTWSRIVWGARRSLLIAVTSLLISVTAGSILGIASGYFGGWLDTMLQRLLDALQSFPPLLLVILAATAFELTVRNIIISFAIVGAPQVSRLVRGNTLALREMPYIEAGRVIGASSMRLMFRHILPNSWATIIVVFTIGIGTVIVAEAGLAFLGISPAGISWGYMLFVGVSFIQTSPWQSVMAGSAITLAVLAFNLLGDALRDILDPRLRI